MPDRVVEFRCPSCTFQIPLLAPGHRHVDRCPECDASPIPAETTLGVDASGLLNFSCCGSCGYLLGRYWGMVKVPGL